MRILGLVFFYSVASGQSISDSILDGRLRAGLFGQHGDLGAFALLFFRLTRAYFHTTKHVVGNEEPNRLRQLGQRVLNWVRQ